MKLSDYIIFMLILKISLKDREISQNAKMLIIWISVNHFY